MNTKRINLALSTFLSLCFLTGVPMLNAQQDAEEKTSFQYVFKNQQDYPVTVTIKYTKASSTDSSPTEDQLRELAYEFLKNYPNKSDGIGIINKELSQAIKKKYPDLTSLLTQIELPSEDRAPFKRIVTAQFIHSRFLEGYIFTYPYTDRSEQSFPLEIKYTFLGGLKYEEYPDCGLLRKRIKAYLDQFPNLNENWEKIKKDLVVYLLEDIPSIDSLEINRV